MPTARIVVDLDGHPAAYDRDRLETAWLVLHATPGDPGPFAQRLRRAAAAQTLCDGHGWTMTEAVGTVYAASRWNPDPALESAS